MNLKQRGGFFLTLAVALVLLVVVLDASPVRNGALAGPAGPSSSRLPDGYSQILRLYVFGPSGFKDYGSATLRCKI